MGDALVRRSGDRLVLQPGSLLAPEARAGRGHTSGISFGDSRWEWGVVGCRVRGTVAVTPGSIIRKNVLSQRGDRRVAVVYTHIGLTGSMGRKTVSQGWVGCRQMLVPICCQVLRMTVSSLPTVCVSGRKHDMQILTIKMTNC